MSKYTPKTAVRLSYTNLIEARAQQNTDGTPGLPTFSTAILIPKTDKETVDGVKAAIKEALEEGVVSKWGGKKPNGLKNPLRDGDTEREDDPIYAGHYFINGKGPKGGKERPVLLDKAGNETESSTVIYSGVEAKVQLQFYPFDKNGNKGVACGISAVMSLETGEPLGNTVTADSAREGFGVSTPASSARDGFSDEAAPAAGAAAASDADDDDPWAS